MKKIEDLREFIKITILKCLRESSREDVARDALKDIFKNEEELSDKFDEKIEECPECGKGQLVISYLLNRKFKRCNINIY